MEFIEGMIQDGSMPPYTTIAENEALALFESGKVAMCMFGSWQSDLFSNENTERNEVSALMSLQSSSQPAIFTQSTQFVFCGFCF